jgi:hypothetical protein
MDDPGMSSMKTFFRSLSIYFDDAGQIETTRIQSVTQALDDAGNVVMSKDGDLQAIPGDAPAVQAALGQALTSALGKVQALTADKDALQADLDQLRALLPQP